MSAYSRYPLAPLLGALIAGLLAGERFFLAREISALASLAGAAWLVIAFCRRKRTIPPALLCFFFTGWFAMTGYMFPDFPAGHVSRFAGQTWWTITGTIISQPTRQAENCHFLLQTRRLVSGKQTVDASGCLRVKIYGKMSGLLPGSSIRFPGRIRRPSNFKNPGAFDYERYLAFQGVSGLAYAAAERVTVLGRSDVPAPVVPVQKIRQRLAVRMEKSGPSEETAAVLQALILGRKKELPPEVRKIFNLVGAGHLLAISGLHVGIIATICFWSLTRLLSFVPALTWRGWVAKAAAPPTMATVIAYGLLAGMAPSTQRAVIMVAVFLTAIVVGKKHTLLNTLALAALIILVLHPPALFSVSFQFSFAAVFFIICGMSTVSGRLQKIRSRWSHRGIGFLLVSLFAILGTAPLAMFYFNQVSLVGLAANCFMVPLIGFVAVPLGLTGAAVSAFSPDLSWLCFQGAAMVIQGALVLARWLAGHAWAAVYTVTPSRLEILCFYTLLWSLLRLLRPSPPENLRINAGKIPDSSSGSANRRDRLAAAAAILAVLILAADAGYWVQRRWLHDDLRVTVLDVGQGNAALIEIPGGRCLLIDGGGFTGSTTFDVGKMIVAPFLWRNKIAAVDTLVLTHPDTDHLAGLRYIAEHFHVKNFWSNGEAVESEPYREVRRVLRKKKIARPPLDQLLGSRRINGIDIDILYPPPDFTARKKDQAWRNTNNNSLVLRISCGQISFLFPGDLMKRGEEELAARAGKRLASTVLIAPHHGSRTSSTAAFLEQVRPRQIIISAGHNNRYGYPHPEVLDRYEACPAEVYCTGRDGAVIMRTRGERLRLILPARK
ncbi:MAG: ComEC/Rec2 family competence protein [Desulfosudaceae bacterium]